MKYLVMECRLSYAVVLSQDGRFLKVANMGYQVGQTVADIVEMREPQVQSPTTQKNNRRWLYALASVAACLVLVITAVFSMGQMTYASVYMTINPEVRIDVNRGDVVVGLEGMNQDGMDLIAEYEYRKKNLDLVMDELVDLAIEMGYLHEGSQITLTLDADDEAWVVSHSTELSNHLNAHLTEVMSVTIEVTRQNPNPGNQSVVIPAEPGDSDYGDTDYGTEPAQSATQPQQSGGSEDSGYDHRDDDRDDDDQYEDDSDDGQTDYGDPADDDYDDDDDSDDDDGQSGYETPEDDDDEDDD